MKPNEATSTRSCTPDREKLNDRGWYIRKTKKGPNILPQNKLLAVKSWIHGVTKHPQSVNVTDLYCFNVFFFSLGTGKPWQYNVNDKRKQNLRPFCTFIVAHSYNKSHVYIGVTEITSFSLVTLDSKPTGKMQFIYFLNLEIISPKMTKNGVKLVSSRFKCTVPLCSQ